MRGSEIVRHRSARDRFERTQKEEIHAINQIEIFNKYGLQGVEEYLNPHIDLIQTRKPKKKDITLVLNQPILLNREPNPYELDEMNREERVLDFPRTEYTDNQLDTIIQCASNPAA